MKYIYVIIGILIVLDMQTVQANSIFGEVPNVLPDNFMVPSMDDYLPSKEDNSLNSESSSRQSSNSSYNPLPSINVNMRPSVLRRMNANEVQNAFANMTPSEIDTVLTSLDAPAQKEILQKMSTNSSILTILLEKNSNGVRTWVQSLSPVEIATIGKTSTSTDMKQILENMNTAEAQRVFNALNISDQARIFPELNANLQQEILLSLPAVSASKLRQTMPNQSVFSADTPKEEVQKLLQTKDANELLEVFKEIPKHELSSTLLSLESETVTHVANTLTNFDLYTLLLNANTDAALHIYANMSQAELGDFIHSLPLSHLFALFETMETALLRTVVQSLSVTDKQALIDKLGIEYIVSLYNTWPNEKILALTETLFGTNLLQNMYSIHRDFVPVWWRVLPDATKEDIWRSASTQDKAYIIENIYDTDMVYVLTRLESKHLNEFLAETSPIRMRDILLRAPIILQKKIVSQLQQRKKTVANTNSQDAANMIVEIQGQYLIRLETTYYISDTVVRKHNGRYKSFIVQKNFQTYEYIPLYIGNETEGIVTTVYDEQSQYQLPYQR